MRVDQYELDFQRMDPREAPITLDIEVYAQVVSRMAVLLLTIHKAKGAGRDEASPRQRPDHP